MNCRKIILIAAAFSMTLFGCSAEQKTEDIPLLQLIAEQSAQPSIDLSKAAALKVSIFYSDHPEPDQTITDVSIITKVSEILAKASVSNAASELSSTKTAVGLLFIDTQGNDICTIQIQNGMLKTQGKGHSVTGLSELYKIDGILFEDDWKSYWEAAEQQNNEYKENMNISYPVPILDMVSYAAHQLHERNELSDVVSIRIRLSWSDMPAFETDDPEIIESIFTALDQMKVTEQADSTADDNKWTIVLGYRVPNETFNSTCSISFIGSTLYSDVMNGNSHRYSLSGLQNFLNSADSEVFDYLKENLASMDR